MFIVQGYARTQIRDIVKNTGISTGALYSLFSGKKAILGFIIYNTIIPGFMERDFSFPIDDAMFSDIYDQVMGAFIENTAKFRENLKDGATDYSFDSLLVDAFELISRYKICLLFIENNPKESGKLWDWYIDFRDRFFEIFAEYINAFISRGAVRPLEDFDLSVRFMLESLSWWAMHLEYQTFEIKVPINKAKQVCLDALIHAYGVK